VSLQAILQAREEKYKMAAGGQCFGLAVHAFVAHACFTDAAYADSAILVWGAGFQI